MRARNILLAIAIFAGGALGGWFFAHRASVLTPPPAPAVSSGDPQAKAANPSSQQAGGGSMANMPGMSSTSQTSGGTPASENMTNMPKGSVMLDPATQQLIGVTYTTVKRAHLKRTITTVGLVQMDSEKVSRVHVKVAGWVEKVYLDYVGQLIKKGEPLFTLYSPDLVSTEQEYLIAEKGESYLGNAPYSDVASGAQSLLSATRARLRLWDISDAQIAELAKTHKVKRTMTLYSPIDGFVMTRNAFPQTYVTPETALYDIADLSTIWVYVDIYEYEAPYVHVGQPASMQLSYYPGRTYYGLVDYVYPTLDPKTRTLKVRLAFPNPHYDLKPNMYANVSLGIDYGVQTLVPSEAILNSGARQVVFLAKPDGYFEPREVQVGDQFNDETQVLAGLKPGEKIVSSGNFLIDSESRLGTAMQMMNMPGMSTSKSK